MIILLDKMHPKLIARFSEQNYFHVIFNEISKKTYILKEKAIITFELDDFHKCKN